MFNTSANYYWLAVKGTWAIKALLNSDVKIRNLSRKVVINTKLQVRSTSKRNDMVMQ